MINKAISVLLGGTLAMSAWADGHRLDPGKPEDTSDVSIAPDRSEF